MKAWAPPAGGADETGRRGAACGGGGGRRSTYPKRRKEKTGLEAAVAPGSVQAGEYRSIVSLRMEYTNDGVRKKRKSKDD